MNRSEGENPEIYMGKVRNKKKMFMRSLKNFYSFLSSVYSVENHIKISRLECLILSDLSRHKVDNYEKSN